MFLLTRERGRDRMRERDTIKVITMKWNLFTASDKQVEVHVINDMTHYKNTLHLEIFKQTHFCLDLFEYHT